MISVLLGKNMSGVHRNSKRHQTLALMYTQLWAHHAKLYKHTGEVNHEADDEIVNSFHSHNVFNVPDPRAMYCTCISQQPYEVGFIFAVEETHCAWAVRLCWVGPLGSSRRILPSSRSFNSVPLNPSLAKRRKAPGFGVTQPWVWVLARSLAAWFLVYFWTSLNFSFLLCRMKVIQCR